jgi:hypothetical protein
LSAGHLYVLRIAAQLLNHDLVLQQLLADALALASGLIDLVDRNDHRYAGALVWLMASTVCGRGRRRPATTSTTMS